MIKTAYRIDLKPEQELLFIPIGDIQYGCVGVAHKILKADLSWAEAGSLKVGEELIGFDEHQTPGKNGSRHLRRSMVVANSIEPHPCVEVELETGERLITTADHPWLVRNHGLEWRRADRLLVGQRVVRSLETWGEDRSWEAGWLSAFFDSEGSLSFSKKKRILTLQSSQNVGPLLDFAVSTLRDKGFVVRVYKNGARNRVVRIMGGTKEILRFLGQMRPQRLMNKLPLEDLRLRRGAHYVKVVSVQNVGKQPVAILGTTTHTYFADGYAMHNTDECDVERLQRLVTWIVKQQKKGKIVRLVGLGDYLDMESPSERKKISDIHETTLKSLDELALMYLKQLFAILEPLKGCFLTLLTGHHVHAFSSNKKTGGWGGKNSDEWLAKHLGCDYGGDGHVLFRMLFPHDTHLTVGAWHGQGGGQTAGWRVNKRIRQGDIYPNADIVIQGHDNCVPMRARALTRAGWKRPEGLALGELVLSYSMESRQCLWTPLLAIHRPGVLPMVRMESKTFSATCSPDHRWVRLNQNGNGQQLLVPGALSVSDRLVVAAKTISGDLPITPDEAALLGWLVTDGHVRLRSGKSPQGIITQSKQEGVRALRRLVAATGAGASERLVKPTGWAKQKAWAFTLKTAWTNVLFDKIEYRTKADLPRIVVALPEKARAAMLEAMLLAEGSRAGSSWVFCQKDGPVLEAFEILATLEGRRLSRNKIPDKNGVKKVYLLSRPRPTMRSIDITEAPPEEAWCPTTAEGTWVMELDGQVSITGNCKVAYPRSGVDYDRGYTKRLAVGSGSFQRAYLDGDTQAGYAEKWGLVPADLGVTIMTITIEKRDGKWRVDYHASV